MDTTHSSVVFCQRRECRRQERPCPARAPCSCKQAPTGRACRPLDRRRRAAREGDRCRRAAKRRFKTGWRARRTRPLERYLGPRSGRGELAGQAWVRVLRMIGALIQANGGSRECRFSARALMGGDRERRARRRLLPLAGPRARAAAVRDSRAAARLPRARLRARERRAAARAALARPRRPAGRAAAAAGDPARAEGAVGADLPPAGHPRPGPS